MKALLLLIINIIMTLAIMWGIYKFILIKFMASISYQSYDNPIITIILILIVCSVLRYILRRN